MSQPTWAQRWCPHFHDDDGEAHHVAVLSVPPIDSAVDGVRAAAVAEKRGRG